MSAKASDFDQAELDIAIALMILLKRKGRGTRYKIELLTYAERWVELSTAEHRQPRRVFHTDSPRLRRIIGQRDSALTPLFVLLPADLE